MAQDFEAFHALNPEVFTALVNLAYEWVNSTGRRQLGIGALYERSRWELMIRTRDPDYKLNNNFRAFYARLIMWHHPDLEGMFSLRASEADEWMRIRQAELR